MGFQKFKFPAFKFLENICAAVGDGSVLPYLPSLDMTTKEHALYIGTGQTYDNTYCIGKHSTMHAGIVAHLSCITHFLLVPFDFMSKSFQNGGHSFRIGQAVFSVFVLWRDFPSRFANNGYCTSERQLPGDYGLTPVPLHPKQVGKVSSYPPINQYRI